MTSAFFCILTLFANEVLDTVPSSLIRTYALCILMYTPQLFNSELGFLLHHDELAAALHKWTCVRVQ